MRVSGSASQGKNVASKCPSHSPSLCMYVLLLSIPRFYVLLAWSGPTLLVQIHSLFFVTCPDTRAFLFVLARQKGQSGGVQDPEYLSQTKITLISP